MESAVACVIDVVGQERKAEEQGNELEAFGAESKLKQRHAVVIAHARIRSVSKEQ